ncbi:MAG: TonB family protein [Desulfotignum sp.]
MNNLDRTGIGNRRLAVYVGISVCAHALFFLMSIWLVQFRVPYMTPEVVQVDLVSFAPGEPGGPVVPEKGADPVPPAPSSAATVTESVVPESQNPPAPEAPEPEPEPVSVLKPDVSLKSKPKNIKELMAEQKEPPKPEPAQSPPPEPQPAPVKKPKNPEADTQQQLARAMERLAKTVEEQDQSLSASGTGTGPAAGSGPGSGRQGGTPLDFYKMVLQSAIQQNWVFNEMLAGLDQNLEVRILIKILKNGEIRDISYETRSGNPYLDQSAKRAIQRANPLPALPKGMISYDVVVIFTPKGLR